MFQIAICDDEQTICSQIEKIILNYFKSGGRQVKIVSTEGEKLFYGKLADVFTKVIKHRFMYIHKSYIVNYAHVSTFRYESVMMTNSIQLPISQPRRKEIRELQMKYQKEEMNYEY
ncbi:LytTR family DNA-binding domain-containing protein [Alkalibaculum bacchi]|uniref:LytTR family DNA-binding domain-containing protein n=1 Tax=Alkalibaculum bacchi TaxID=645887 RepID=UPI0026EAEB15|nr:LytTR family DNA-binding domain-containing protein [Alkalibaculum bacchi]